MDKITPEQRSYTMSRLRSKDTKLEMLVRRHLHALGFRYRLHSSKLPGHPDIVLPKWHTVIFVNGCFWHKHEGCKYFVIPKTRIEFWLNKVNRNQERDIEVKKKLASMGWHSITIWECELKTNKKDATLQSLVYTLCKIFLQDNKVKRYELPEEETPIMVADNNEIKFCKT